MKTKTIKSGQEEVCSWKKEIWAATKVPNDLGRLRSESDVSRRMESNLTTAHRPHTR